MFVKEVVLSHGIVLSYRTGRGVRMLRAENPQHPPQITVDSYSGYSGLPPLVGLHSMREATTTGLTVAESVARLKRLHWSLRRLHRVFFSRITSMPIYELKMAFSLHAHYCA